MREPVLDIRQLKVSFRTPDGASFAALDHVDLTIGRGSFAALVGPSGSGKSVLALSLCRLVRDDGHSGGVYYYYGDGTHLDITNCPLPELEKVRGKHIAYIFQDPGACLDPVLKIGPQVDEALLAHEAVPRDEARGRTLKLLRSMAFDDPARIYESYAHELSGGMKQRAMIAMALAAGPRVLVADEPTTALDPETEKGILDLLKRLQAERGLTVLFITHNISLAKRYADAFHVIERGRLADANGTLAKKLMAASLEGLRPKQMIPV